LNTNRRFTHVQSQARRTHVRGRSAGPAGRALAPRLRGRDRGGSGGFTAGAGLLARVGAKPHAQANQTETGEVTMLTILLLIVVILLLTDGGVGYRRRGRRGF
jgi:hypothetical protein